MNYHYQLLIDEVDRLVEQHGDDVAQFSWSYIKTMVHAHAQYFQEEGESLAEAEARVWSDWEYVFSLEEEDFLDPHLFMLKGLVDLYKYAAPSFAEFHFWLEVAFLQARGMTRSDAMHNHYAFLELQGGYERFYGEPDPRYSLKKKVHGSTRRKPSLRILQGGLFS